MRVLLLILGFFLCGQTGADSFTLPVANFNPDVQQLDITSFVLIMKDESRALTIQAVDASHDSLPFFRLADHGKSFGFDDSAYWLKFTLAVDPEVKEPLVLHFAVPFVDEIVLFSASEDGGFSKKEAGEIYPLVNRDIAFRNPVFILDQDSGSRQTYYLRVETEGQLQIPLSILSYSSMMEYSDYSGIVYGIYYGIMALLMLAALVAYIYIRQFIYLSYALYLFSFGLFQLSLNGFGYQYIWSDSGILVNAINAFAMSLVVICGLLFAGTFLRVWAQFKQLEVVYYLVLGMSGVTLLLSLLGISGMAIRIAAFTGLLFAPLVLLTAILAVISGNRSARFFLLAWSVFLSGIFITCLNYFGILDNTFLTYNAMQIASLLEILILAYVLVNNLHSVNDQKRSATLAAKHLLEQLNHDLEEKVAIRTRELNERNQMLSDLALRDSMTGLLNHNSIIDRLDLMLKNAVRYGHKLSVAMIDIDHFKSINDSYGHQAGDAVIRRVAEVIEKSIRRSDSCGRYGGEEFLVVFSQASADKAYERAEKIRREIMNISISEINDFQITASIGISEFNDSHPQLDLLKQADNALYRVKQSGRNNTFLALPQIV